MKRKTTTMLAGLCLVALSFAGLTEAAMSSATLNPKQASIVPIAAFTAKGDLDNLALAVNSALDAKSMTINEIREVIVQMYAYTGFPRSLNAMNTLIAVLDERKARGLTDEVGREASPLPTDKSRLEYGTAIQTGLIGRPASGRTYEFAPIMDEFLKEHLFADIFLRDLLDHQERELATVGALASLPGAQSQLGSHLNICLNVGLTETQLSDFVKVLNDKVGRMEADNPAGVLADVLKNRQAAGQ